MNQKFIKSIFLGSLVAGALAFGNFGVNAANNNHTAQVANKSMSSAEFYQVVATTKTKQLAANFGFPDQFKSLKNAKGEVEGVVWVYRDIVEKNNEKQDALFVLVNGELKYVTLSSES